MLEIHMPWSVRLMCTYVICILKSTLKITCIALSDFSLRVKLEGSACLLTNATFSGTGPRRSDCQAWRLDLRRPEQSDCRWLALVLCPQNSQIRIHTQGIRETTCNDKSLNKVRVVSGRHCWPSWKCRTSTTNNWTGRLANNVCPNLFLLHNLYSITVCTVYSSLCDYKRQLLL